MGVKVDQRDEGKGRLPRQPKAANDVHHLRSKCASTTKLGNTLQTVCGLVWIIYVTSEYGAYTFTQVGGMQNQGRRACLNGTLVYEAKLLGSVFRMSGMQSRLANEARACLENQPMKPYLLR